MSSLQIRPLAVGIALAWTLFAAQVSVGQSVHDRPWGIADARTLIQGVIDDLPASGPLYAISVCSPPPGSWRDSLIVGLAALEVTPKRVGQMGIYWARAAAECNDPRIDDWLRRALMVADEYSGRYIIKGLLNHPTPENEATIRDLIFDPTRPEALRSMAVSFMREGKSLEERKALFTEVYLKSGSIPSSYSDPDDMLALSNSAIGDRFKFRLAELVAANPTGASAEMLLGHLSYLIGQDAEKKTPSAAWIRKWRETVDQLANRDWDRLSPRMRESVARFRKVPPKQ